MILEYLDKGTRFWRSSIFTFKMITSWVGTIRNFIKKISFSEKKGSFIKFGRFWPSFTLKITSMVDNIDLQSFATASRPFCLTSDQVSSIYFKWLSRKCPKTIKKGTQNWPFLGQIFSQKTKSYEKMNDTLVKDNSLQIPNIKSDYP